MNFLQTMRQWGELPPHLQREIRREKKVSPQQIARQKKLALEKRYRHRLRHWDVAANRQTSLEASPRIGSKTSTFWDRGNTARVSVQRSSNSSPQKLFNNTVTSFDSRATDSSGPVVEEPEKKMEGTMAPIRAGQVHFNTAQDFRSASKGSKSAFIPRTKNKLFSTMALVSEAEVEDKSEAKLPPEQGGKTPVPSGGSMTLQQQRRATRLEALGVRTSLELSTATMSTMASMSNTSFPATGSTSSFPYSSDDKFGLPTINNDGTDYALNDRIDARGLRSKSLPQQGAVAVDFNFQGAPGVSTRRRGGSQLPLMVRPSIVDGRVQSIEYATYKSQGRRQRKKNMAWVSTIGPYGTAADTSEDTFNPKTETLTRAQYGSIKLSTS